MRQKKKICENTTEFIVCWPSTAWHGAYPQALLVYPVEPFQKNLFFSLKMTTSCSSFLLMNGSLCPLPSLIWEPSCLNKTAHPDSRVRMCISLVVSGKHCFLGVHLLWLTIFLPPLLCSSLCPKRRGLMKSSHFRINIQKSVSISISVSPLPPYIFQLWGFILVFTYDKIKLL